MEEAEWPCSVLTYVEADFFARELTKSSFYDLGSIPWLEKHKRCHFLYLEAVYQASKMEEPELKNMLLINNKVHVLVHESMLIRCWRTKVLPVILSKIPRNVPRGDVAASNFDLLLHGILYHEVATSGILAHLLFDEEICELVGEDGPDIVDYCCYQVAEFLALCPTSPSSNTAKTTAGEGKPSIEEFVFGIFIRTFANAIPILRFLACHSDRLSPSFSTRMLVTHDVPMLVVQLLNENRLGCLDNKEHMLFSTTEHHAWILLTILLFSPEATYKYEITPERKAEFLKLRKLLTPEKVEMNVSLSILRRWLDGLSLGAFWQNRKAPSVIETSSASFEHLTKEAENKKSDLAHHFLTTLTRMDEKQLYKWLSSAYEVDKLLYAYDSVLKGSAETINITGSSRLQPTKILLSDFQGSSDECLERVSTFHATITPNAQAFPGQAVKSAGQNAEETIKQVGSKLSFGLSCLVPKSGLGTVTSSTKSTKFSFLKGSGKPSPAHPFTMD